jgi:hypothetical protein
MTQRICAEASWPRHHAGNAIEAIKDFRERGRQMDDHPPDLALADGNRAALAADNTSKPGCDLVNTSLPDPTSTVPQKK